MNTRNPTKKPGFSANLLATTKYSNKTRFLTNRASAIQETGFFSESIGHNQVF
jgi:hypothetical protein